MRTLRDSSIALLLAGLFLIGAGCGRRAGPSGSGPALGPPHGGLLMWVPSRAQKEVFDRLVRYREMGQLDRGIQYFSTAVRQAPKFPVPYVALGMLQEIKGDLKDARANAQRAIDLSGGRHPMAFQLMGNVDLHEGKLDDALTDYDNQRRSAPRSTPMAMLAYVNLAYVHLWKDGPARARSELQKALALNPTNPQALMLLAALDRIDGHADAARDDIERGLQQAPPGPQAMGLDAGRAGLLLDAGRLDAAKESINRSLGQFPGRRMLVQLQMDLLARQPGASATLPQAAFNQIALGPLPQHLPIWRAHYKK